MRSRILALVAALALAAACTEASERIEGPSESPSMGPWRGGTLRWLDTSYWVDDARYFDPTAYLPSPIWELSRCCLLRTLVSFNGRPTERGGTVPRPDLVSSMPVVSADGLSWTFRLRSGVRYAPPLEEVEVASKDVVRALERLGTPEAIPGFEYAFYYTVIEGFNEFRSGTADRISGLETPDEHTLVVRLTEPTGDLAYRFALPATAPIPDGVPVDRPDDYIGALVASGPYMIEGAGEVDPTPSPGSPQLPAGLILGRSVSLVRNPSWDARSDPLRRAYVDRIEIRFVGRLEGRERRELDRRVYEGRADVGPYLEREISRHPELEPHVVNAASNALHFLPLNLAVPPFDDVHVRKALVLAMDREEVARLNEVASGLFEIANHAAPDGSEGGLLATYRPTWVMGPHADLSAAREEMRRSGYDRDGDGRCDDPVCRGVRIATVEEWGWDALRPVLESALEAIGISVRPEMLAADDGWQRASDPGERFGMFAVLGWTWETDFPNASTVFVPQYYGPSLTDGPGNQVFSLMGASRAELERWGYPVKDVPSIDERIRRCIGIVGTQQLDCWAELDRYVMEDVVPIVPLFFPHVRFVTGSRVASYAYDQAVGASALDQIALVPGSA